jgi:D-threo-aldose 1-dehydrogenase
LGCAPLGGMYGDIPEPQADEVVRTALRLGLNLYDTAPLYGSGKSEARLGRVLRTVPRDQYVLCTKVGRKLLPAADSDRGMPIFDSPPPLRPVFDFSYDAVMRTFEDSLRRLGTGRIDVLHIHDPDDHYRAALDGAYRAIDELRTAGVIRAVGAGMNQCEMLVRLARDAQFDCFLLAGRYSLLEQTALDELFPLCLEKQIGIILGGTYNSGVLAKRSGPEARYNYTPAPEHVLAKVERLHQVAQRHGVDLRAAASQFALAHPAVTAIVPGTRLPQRVVENYQLLQQPIAPEFWDDLRREGLIRADAPTPPA